MDRLHLDLGVLGVEPDVRIEITVMMVGALVLVGVLMLAVSRPQLNVLGRLDHTERIAAADEQIVRPRLHIRAIIDENVGLFEVFEVVGGRLPVVRLGAGGDHVGDVDAVAADLAGKVVHGVEARQHAQDGRRPRRCPTAARRSR